MDSEIEDQDYASDSDYYYNLNDSSTTEYVIIEGNCHVLAAVVWEGQALPPSNLTYWGFNLRTDLFFTTQRYPSCLGCNKQISNRPTI